MLTILYGDDPFFLNAAWMCVDCEATVITQHSALLQLNIPPERARILHFDSILSSEVFNGVPERSSVEFMLCFASSDRQDKALEAIHKAGFNDCAFILIQHEPLTDAADKKDGRIFRISTSSLVQDHVCASLKKLENIKRILELRALNQSADNVLILMQHDPDPDALASGLALRTLLERNRQTAPLGSFGEVTRSENINMIRVLDIPVLKATPEMLDKFSLIAMVDVQPPYFLDMCIPCDIVIDHHPYLQSYGASYTDIRTDYGATSTILGEYLIDAKIPVSQRLSTALVYGIKTDTMSLERDISHADLEVFTRLYTLANLSMIRQIESASLDMAEIQIFIKALQHLTMIDKMACTWLGHIRHDDMIPRLADFSLQVAGAEWSFAAGIANNMVVCSARNVGYVRHAGELMYQVFGSLGSAGGHRSTAKAVIPVAQFKKKYNLRSTAEIPAALFAALQEANR